MIISIDLPLRKCTMYFYKLRHIVILKEKLSTYGQTHAENGIGALGYFENSKASGTFWVGMFGGKPNGHLHGTIDVDDGTITGDNISYIYPDMETALLGRFENAVMIKAQESTVLDVKCAKNGLFYVSKYKAPELLSPRFFFERPSNVSFGGGPKDVYDPFEKRWLEVRQATEPNMGDGVFVKKDLKKGMLISSFAGYIYGKNNGELAKYINDCEMNISKSDDERRHCRKYTLPLRTKDAFINIPPENDINEIFLPSMGPKVCKKI